MSRSQSSVKNPVGRQVTMDDVAREARVSRALVSLVMQDSPKVSEKRRDRVLAAAEQLGYRPNAMARGLASRRTRTVGVLLNDLHNPYFAEILDGIMEAADELEYRLLIATGRRQAVGERRAVGVFLEHRVGGLVLVGPRLPTAEIIMAGRAIPTVSVGRPLRSVEVDSIGNDDHAGGRLAVQHLVDLGHRRIAHVDGGRGAGAQARKRGYLQAMRQVGGQAHVVPGDFTDSAGVRAAEQMLTMGDRPTAVFAANDVVAAGVMGGFEDAGLRIPEDVSIIGYDNTFLAALHHMSLTTIDQPRPQIGRLAFSMLVERIDGVRGTAVHRQVKPSLVVRATTAPPTSR